MDPLDQDQIFSETLHAAALAAARVPAPTGEDDQHTVSLQRTQKIEMLKRQIADGTYKPDTAELSKRMIDDHLGK